MPDNVIPGAEFFKFKGIDLHGVLVSSTYTRKRRIAVHEYLKRDGGQTEDMGREPFRVQIAVTFVGQDFRADATRLAASIDENPNGQFVDPLFGEFPATCEGFDRAQLEPDRAVNSITLPLSFVENNIDARLSASQSKGASTAAQAIEERSVDLNAIIAAATYATAVAQQAVYDVTTAAGVYAAAALNSFLQTSIDPSLTTRLGEIAGLVATAQAALVLAAGSEVVAYDAITGTEMVAAACADLQQAILDARPPMGRYTIPTLTHVVALMQQFYGTEGLPRVDEFLANNPDVADPAAIEAGTVVVMAQPTV